MRYLIAITAFALLTACSQQEAPSAASSFKPNLSVIQTMDWVLDPAADGIWGNSGWEITLEKGEVELFPTTDEGWDQMLFAAATISEIGNILMVPNREGLPEDTTNWNAYAQGIIDTGDQLIEAAANHDKQAIFDLGGQLYNVCVACHQAYIREP